MKKQKNQMTLTKIKVENGKIPRYFLLKLKISKLHDSTGLKKLSNEHVVFSFEARIFSSWVTHTQSSIIICSSWAERKIQSVVFCKSIKISRKWWCTNLIFTLKEKPFLNQYTIYCAIAKHFPSLWMYWNITSSQTFFCKSVDVKRKTCEKCFSVKYIKLQKRSGIKCYLLDFCKSQFDIVNVWCTWYGGLAILLIFH